MITNPWRFCPPLLLVLAVLLTTACQPPPAKMVPVPDRVAITSDSIGLQAMYYGSGGTPATGWDYAEKIGLGWRARDAQPRLTRDVSGTTTSPNTVVVEFGHNYRTGFGTDAKNEVTTLVYTAHETACIVMVLPYAPPFLSATVRQAIADYRAHAVALSQLRPGVVLVDWAPIAQAHPEYLDEDGIHLRTPDTTPAEDLIAAAEGEVNTTDPTAARAFIDLMVRGVDRCG